MKQCAWCTPKSTHPTPKKIMSDTTENIPDSPAETQSGDGVGLSSDDLLSQWKHIQGAEYEQGLVLRMFNVNDDTLPTIGIRCNDQQAILIKRLCGQIPMNKFKDMGFSEEETRELLNMYETI